MATNKPTTTQKHVEELILRNNARRYPFSGPAGTAQALVNAGWVIPDLPAPNVTSIEGYHTGHPWAIWHAEDNLVSVDNEGTVHIENHEPENSIISMSPGQTESLIAALTAAVRYSKEICDD